jgi:hypothetical protein
VVSLNENEEQFARKDAYRRSKKRKNKYYWEVIPEQYEHPFIVGKYTLEEFFKWLDKEYGEIPHQFKRLRN